MAWSRRRLLAAAPAAALAGSLAHIVRPEPGLVEAELVAAPGTVEVAGRRVSMWLYGGRMPGPPLVLREGKTLRLRFSNRLPEPTNLHFHGLRIPPSGRADNVFVEIPPAGPSPANGRSRPARRGPTGTTPTPTAASPGRCGWASPAAS